MQKFALRVCTKQWDVPYLDLIEKCNLPELKTRRNCLGLGLLYKIINEDCLSKCSPCTLYHNIFHTLTVNQHVRGTSVSYKFAPKLFLPPYNLILELSPTSHNFKFLNCLVQISLAASYHYLIAIIIIITLTTFSHHGYMLCTSAFLHYSLYPLHLYINISYKKN